MNVYSADKALWHIDAIGDMRMGAQIVPRQVHLIISDLCNHDCHFCAYRMNGGFSTELFGEHTDKGYRKNPTRFIPTSKAKEILDDCKALGVKAIQFTGGGEPTVHKDHIEIIRHAQRLGLETALVTNGCLLSEGWESVFPNLSWLRVSLDAGTEETYCRVRAVRGFMWQRVNNNMRNIFDVLRATNSACVYGVGYVVTPENCKEIVAGCAAAKKGGASNVRLAAMFSEDGSKPYADIYEDVKKQIRLARTLFDDDSFTVYDLFGERISDLDQGAPNYKFCGYQQFVTYIGGDQKIYRCCTTSYTKHGLVGDLTKQRFRAWFSSREKHDKYKNFDARSCRVCQFNNKNAAVNFAVEESPTHVNFV